MADLRRVEVIFKNASDEVKKPSEKVKSTTNNVVKKQNTDYIGAVVVNQAWNIAKQSIIQIGNYEINKWFSLNDDYIGQRNLSNALNVISKVKNFGVTIAGGFAVGGPIGAAIAGIGSLILTGIDVAQHIDRQNLQLKQMDAQLQYQRQRAGYSLTSGRVGENR